MSATNSTSAVVIISEGDTASVTPLEATSSNGGSNPKKKVWGKWFPKLQDGDKYPFLETLDSHDEELFRTLASMEMPPWEDKGQTTKPGKMWLSFLRRTLTVFPTGVKDGIIKKRFEGAVEFMTKFQGTWLCISGGASSGVVQRFLGLKRGVSNCRGSIGEIRSGTSSSYSWCYYWKPFS
jgi:hypothetical protein